MPYQIMELRYRQEHEMVGGAGSQREEYHLHPHFCPSSNTPPKHLYSEMDTTDWRWETQVRSDNPG